MTGVAYRVSLRCSVCLIIIVGLRLVLSRKRLISSKVFSVVSRMLAISVLFTVGSIVLSRTKIFYGGSNDIR